MKKIVFGVIFLLLFCSLASAFSFANLIGYVVKNNAPNVNLITPKNDGVTGKLIFTWLYKDAENDPQTQYLLQLDDDWRFESPYNFYGLDKSTVKIEIPLPEGTYYWRVQVKDAYGWSKFSDWRRFDLDLSVKTCSDGTRYGECSKTLPKYCQNGKLVDICSLCGCAEGLECSSDGSCASVKIMIKDQEVTQPITLLEYIVDFFKGLFGSL